MEFVPDVATKPTCVRVVNAILESRHPPPASNAPSSIHLPILLTWPCRTDTDCLCRDFLQVDPPVSDSEKIDVPTILYMRLRAKMTPRPAPERHQRPVHMPDR